MNENPLVPVSEAGSKKPTTFLPWFVAVVLGMAVLIAWLAWPSESDTSPVELSRTDGKPRFRATTYPKAVIPNPPLHQRLYQAWLDYKERHRKRNPAAYSFPATPVQLCGIEGLLSQCMEVTGTKYLIAVEALGGTVGFGNTNTLNGAQWVKAFEHAIETSDAVLCYDYIEKRAFQDKLLLIREGPTLVKVVPRTKLSEYQKAGLVKVGTRQTPPKP